MTKRKQLEQEILLQLIWLYMMDNPGEVRYNVIEDGKYIYFYFNFEQ